jgi:plastocyanin
MLMGRLLAVVLLIVGGVACGTEENLQPGGTPSPQIEREEIGGVQVIIRGHAEVTVGAAEIAAENNFFDPTILAGPARATVNVSLKNPGSVLHNFSLPDQGIDQDLEGGSESTLTVTFPAEGRFVFFCKYHREESGMVGALEVKMS